MKLAQVPLRTCCRILGFDEALNPSFRTRLRELGFCEGARVELIRKLPFGGPRVFRVADAVFSIEPEISGLINVESQSPS